MAVATDILIQIPKTRKCITGEPITGIIQHHLDEETVYNEINLSPVVKKSGSWYEYIHYYETNKVRNHHKLEEHKTYVLLDVKMVNKNPDGSVRSSNESVEAENITPLEETDKEDGIKRYHVEILFKKPIGIFGTKTKFKTIIKVYPTVVSEFPDDPFLSELDRTLTQLFSSKKHEINVTTDLDKGFFTPSKEIKVSFVVANNTDLLISFKTVSKRIT